MILHFPTKAQSNKNTPAESDHSNGVLFLLVMPEN
jgi:hypothetical protein